MTAHPKYLPIAADGTLVMEQSRTRTDYQNAAVDQYLDQHGEFTRTDIRNRLAQSYQTARVKETEDAGVETPSGDRIFFRLLHDITPDAGKQVQDAAIVLIAYFFEKYDVFEDPSV